MVHHACDEIILQKNLKMSAEDDAHENIDSKVDKNNLYDIYNISIDEKKVKKELRKHAFESEL